jgi:hypothetical protein
MRQQGVEFFTLLQHGAAFQKPNRGTLRTSPTPFQFLDDDCAVGIDTDLQPVSPSGWRTASSRLGCANARHVVVSSIVAVLTKLPASRGMTLTETYKP